MTMPELFSEQENQERDQRLNRWLTDFFALNKYDMTELQYILDKTWERYVQKHAFSLARERTFGSPSHLVPRTEEHIEQLRIRSNSLKKWSLLQPVVLSAGLKPILDEEAIDEDHIHELVRRWFDHWEVDYPLKVARLKQPDRLTIPSLTLDTVTYVDDTPLEKPKTHDEACRLIRIATGGEVSTVTSWVLVMYSKSGSTLEFLNISKITYSIQPMSAAEIHAYVQSEPNIFTVPVGLDLSTNSARMKFIDASQPVAFYARNHMGQEGQLRLQSTDLHSAVFDAYFSGVPVHAIGAFLPKLNDIYLHADPYYKEKSSS